MIEGNNEAPSCINAGCLERYSNNTYYLKG